MKARALSLGVDIDFETQVGNSLDSLRLLHWAGSTQFQPGTQEQLAGIMAKGHFAQRKSVGDHAMLLAFCDEAGLPVQEARDILATDRYKTEVEAAIRQIQNSGVHSIPVFLFNGGDAISGAASVAEYEAVVRRIDAELQRDVVAGDE